MQVFDVCMVLENQIMYKIDKKTEFVPALFAMFFVFHLSYPPGTFNLFHFLEFLFLKVPLGKKQSLLKFWARLDI